MPCEEWEPYCDDPPDDPDAHEDMLDDWSREDDEDDE